MEDDLAVHFYCTRSFPRFLVVIVWAEGSGHVITSTFYQLPTMETDTACIHV